MPKQPKRTRTCAQCGEAFRAGPHAKYCPVCRPGQRRAKRIKYAITDPVKRLLTSRYDSKVPGRAAEIAASLGWPTWAVKKAACKLGLTRPWPKDRRAWTEAEVAILEKWSGVRSSGWIGRRLGRGLTSVVLKQKRLGLSRRVRNGYAVRQLCDCFGVDHHTVDRWIDRGWLRATVQPTDRPLVSRRVQPDAIREFLRVHREEYRLDQVDQAWFLALLFDEEDQLPNQSRPCSRCGKAFIDPAKPYSRICPDCRRKPGRATPTPQEIAARAKAIREANGHGLASTPGRLTSTAGAQSG